MLQALLSILVSLAFTAVSAGISILVFYWMVDDLKHLNVWLGIFFSWAFWWLFLFTTGTLAISAGITAVTVQPANMVMQIAETLFYGVVFYVFYKAVCLTRK